MTKREAELESENKQLRASVAMMEVYKAKLAQVQPIRKSKKVPTLRHAEHFGISPIVNSKNTQGTKLMQTLGIDSLQLKNIGEGTSQTENMLQNGLITHRKRSVTSLSFDNDGKITQGEVGDILQYILNEEHSQLELFNEFCTVQLLFCSSEDFLQKLIFLVCQASKEQTDLFEK